ncbi:MAG: hypothetical protein WAK37_18785, partial [Pseudolabrys sp.]
AMYTICSLFAICSFREFANLSRAAFEFGLNTFATGERNKFRVADRGDIQLEEIARIPSTRCGM